MKKLFFNILILFHIVSAQAQTPFPEGIELPKGSNLAIGQKIQWGWTNGPFISSLSTSSNDPDVQGLVFYTHPSGTNANPPEEAFRINHDGDLEFFRGSIVGGFGSKLRWGSINGPFISSVMLGSDPDSQGLSFYVHPSATFSDTPIEAMRIAQNGNVGIGTTTPISKLSIRSSGNGASLLRLDTERPWEFIQTGAGATTNLVLQSTVDGKRFIIQSPQGTQNASFFTDDTPASNSVVFCPDGGKVGIGTSNLDEMLTVDGKILAEEIIVADVDGVDFVFESDYQLPSLQETENFIQANKHLPGIPSAKQMQEDGLTIGEMNIMLLQKIEELTLYVIELKKENEKLKTETNRIDQLELLLNELIQPKN